MHVANRGRQREVACTKRGRHGKGGGLSSEVTKRREVGTYLSASPTQMGGSQCLFACHLLMRVGGWKQMGSCCVRPLCANDCPVVELKKGQKGDGVTFCAPCANEEAGPQCFLFTRPVLA